MLDEVTTIGLFRTLVSLLGSFFWINLTTWLRDVVALKAQASYYKNRGNQEELAKVRHQVAGLGDWTTYATTLAVLLGVVLLVSALTLADDIPGGLGRRLLGMLWVFLGVSSQTLECSDVSNRCP